MARYSPTTLKRAKKLRRDMTDAEAKLWSALRNRGVAGAKFRSQQPIGPFVGDFVCLEARLIIEADGGHHADSRTDAQRTAYLEREGYRILRFWNHDILTNLDGVCQDITRVLQGPHPPTASRRAPPSPQMGEGIGDEHA